MTEDEIRYRNARILEVLGCGRETPFQDMTDGAADLLPSRERGRAVLTPPQAPPLPDGRGSVSSGAPPVTLIGTDSPGAPPAIDRVSRIPTNESNRPVAPARRLAGAVLALFAPIVLAGPPAASARPTWANPVGPIGRRLELLTPGPEPVGRRRSLLHKIRTDPLSEVAPYVDPVRPIRSEDVGSVPARELPSG